MEVATEQPLISHPSLCRIRNDASLQRTTEHYASFTELKETLGARRFANAEKRGWRAEKGGEGFDIAIQNRSSYRIAVLQPRNQELPINK